MRDVLVLCYHAVSRDWKADLAIHPDVLAEQVSSILRRGYRPATFSDAVTAPAGGRTFAVTFDDAYRSVLDVGRPVLDSLGVPGTVYAPTAFMGSERPMLWPEIEQWRDSPHEQELVPMTWEELDVLAEGGWEIGSHGRTHLHLPSLGDAELRSELGESRLECESRLGRPCRSIAYPFGDVDRRVADAARGAGYETGAALPLEWHRPERLLWPRVGVYSWDDPRRFRVKTSQLLRRVRALPGAHTLRSLVPRRHHDEEPR